MPPRSTHAMVRDPDGERSRTKVAIIGSGNIGTDLMIKIERLSESLDVAVLVGIDPDSDGLARARRLGIDTTADGIQGLLGHPAFPDIDIVLDATSAAAHVANAAALEGHGKHLVDLTPAAIGPYVVPSVNLTEHLGAPNINMVTCGGQATIPIVAAVSSVTDVEYGEIVASIASLSAGPGTRANIDEFTETTRRALEQIGGADRGKAIIVLNPADPPLIMRDTVLCLTGRLGEDERARVREAIAVAVAAVAEYVRGYRLKHAVQFTDLESTEPIRTLANRGGAPEPRPRTKVTALLEVEGAAHYLPSYAGNLDIMTSAALRVAEQVAAHGRQGAPA